MSFLILKVKSKNGQEVVKEFTALSTFGKFKARLSEVTSIPFERLALLRGFPPKQLNITDDKCTLQDVGLSSGDVLIAEDVSVTEDRSVGSATLDNAIGQVSVEQKMYMEQVACSRGILMKKIVPADNSCLFTSIGYAINRIVDTSIETYMRKIIAQFVSSNPVTYSEAMLGRPNLEYCSWIKKSDSWGGAIEVSILSAFYKIEIAVVDTQNAIINLFGEDMKYKTRMFLLYDGIHYDPLYMEPAGGGECETIFSTEDDVVLVEAEQLARDARSARQFTDVERFTIRCMECNILLVGHFEAQVHAKETLHTRFGEV